MAPAGVPAAMRAAAGPRRPGQPRVGTGRVDVIAVGCSTGGPDALTRVLTKLPAHLPVPVVVVQHMPPVFTAMFAERLNRLAAVDVVEATDGAALRPGTVYIAPGDRHLEVVRHGTTTVSRLHAGPPENFCRPAVDVLFRSVAAVFGGAAIAVVLTGMGQDGARGCRPLQAAGAEIVVQDEASSVVWGMPGAVANAGLATAVLTLDQLSAHLIRRTARTPTGVLAEASP
jgi:two-component system chemotaxis response regulator CheB